MTYKEQLTVAMTRLADEPKVVFLGYNVGHGSKGGGTLKGVPDKQLIEMPLAENLMVGAAIGMALEGGIPVVYFERFDFITNALDAVVNHLDKIAIMSKGEFKPCCLLRIVVGNVDKPLYTGITHTQNFTRALRAMVSFPVETITYASEVIPAYVKALKLAQRGICSTALVEYKDYYEENHPSGDISLRSWDECLTNTVYDDARLN